ncbi:hypothetical protein M3Y94_01059900 [Aphelenchoides besseyi]|nr:hypothetical protein M3Y94_01059900 [Aphelenchoides besseyi]KAI6224173.1 hypothetical protein M3Y95_00855000 [Aphelenchoides besseyi]
MSTPGNNGGMDPRTKSSPNQGDQSKKMADAPVPMELAVDAQAAEERTRMKKFFMKLGERIGTVRKTEYSTYYLQAVGEVDQYKTVVEENCKAIMGICQQDPNFCPPANGKQESQAPKDKDPWERLDKQLGRISHFWINEHEHPKPHVLEAARASAKEMAKAQRQFQARVRKYTHFHRTFLLVDYVNLSEERKKLMNRCKEMDFARYDYTTDPNDERRLSFERAEQRYKDQVQKILSTLRNLPAIQKQHADEIMYIMIEILNFHRLCQLECEKLRIHRHAMGPETPYELL